MNDFHELGVKTREKNIWRLYQEHFTATPNTEKIKGKLREFDTLANVLWPLAHLKSAGRYLHKDPEDIKATGGTNWQKYLPPKFQRIMFFPDLWTDQEKGEWGRAAVEKLGH